MTGVQTCALPISADGAALEITVNGLNGGHSGVEINKGRANANILMGRILIALSSCVKYNLASFAGGSKDNAIPRESKAVICLAQQDMDQVGKALTRIQDELSNEYAVTDKNIRITSKAIEAQTQMLDEASTRQAVLFVNAMSNGIQTMSADVEGLVETSLNLGILELSEKEMLLSYAVRSSVGSAKEALLEKMTYLTQAIGGTVEISGDYPAWEYKRDSAFRDKIAAVYEKMYGKPPVIEAIHAGLECGLLVGKLPGLDCISIGPDMKDVHTTEEKLSISSTKRVWEFLLEILKTKA